MSATPDRAEQPPTARSVEARYRQRVFPADYHAPRPQGVYHLVVIGAGPAGLVASIAAASLGARVALIERRAMGGDCLNVGCVPSKTLLAAAAAGRSFEAAMERVRGVRARIAHHDSVERYTGAGVDVFLGKACFETPHRIRVGHLVLDTRKTLIATGARPFMPPIPGLAELGALTNETVFDLRVQPRRLAILGAGAVGCELAQAFARLGTEVELIEAASQVLAGEEAQAADLIADALRREGVALHLGNGACSASMSAQGKILTLNDGRRVAADEVLVAAGRRRNVEELSLERAQVRLDSRGAIEVDARLRTSHPDIFAAGDVCSTFQFTHSADAQARIVVRNALFRGRARADRLIVPRCIYTQPELAQVGATALELEQAGRRFERYRLKWGELDRGVTDADEEGFAEVRTDAGGRILGATLVGRDAGEQIAPLALLMTQGRGLGSIGSLVLPYPTRSEYLRRLADQYARGRLTPWVAKALRAWLRHAR